ncbi:MULTISPECIES: inorganic phosphate transporter [Halobacterium]|uniref:Sodium-dependent phosphate transporter n=3 Tax=Halobacterium salinarum TaxID=2242 RepID=Q9HHW5_HALSA|nr:MULTISPECIES: inorganic phosphate transporter [Halobacterium]AAG20861.1 sodium-dependent phosphate transporter [Halobacterium salinarum NRC-1]MBB6090628.1 PiT family inorganic phosphate transporter [Halobacterium salinarum]MCF2208010.1 inorganic phosphate transporter family protein [Halobacterium salinarum]MCF2240822.1 anion permease [Halobacterium salinarum]MDL0119981.1 inorganic phosphate transporter [Halobacterium salinarum]
MALSVVFVVGVAAAIFVGVNIGGSSTGVAFGPATGSDALSMRQASGLMAVFVLLGGFTIGTNVVDALGADFIPAEYFTLGASIGVLLFIGLGILIGNVLNVSTSTSQTAVAAVVAMGAALGVLDWRTVGVVGMWWVLSTTLAFWICAFVGRYFYDAIVNLLSFESDDTGRFAELVVIGIGCYMGFSTGASNVASAVAPLVGSRQLEMTSGVAIGGVAIGVGAFAIGPRTMETVGEDITDLSLEASPDR